MSSRSMINIAYCRMISLNLSAKSVLSNSERDNVTVFDEIQFKPYNAEFFLYKPWRPKGFFQYEIIITVLALSA